MADEKLRTQFSHRLLATSRSEMRVKMNKVSSGKVRDIYEVTEDTLMIVTTDRISAFDCVLNSEIPNKGKYLNELSNFWFHFTEDIVDNHSITSDVSRVPNITKGEIEMFEGRALYVKKLRMIPYEIIVRGYIFGSMWEEYLLDKSFCEEKITHDYKLAEKLVKPIVTPSKKNNLGHDEYVTMEEFYSDLGKELADKIVSVSLKLYERCSKYAMDRGIIIADTKFEFGFDKEQQLLLGDEIFTPDSSRFWDAKEYSAGNSPKSYDKQFVRDWLMERGLAGIMPAPVLPDDIINKTVQLYKKCAEIITDRVIMQECYWDSVAEKKKFKTQLNIDFLKKYVNKDSYILDIGCGYGRTLRECKKNGYKNLFGIDFSKNMIKRGKSENPEMNLQVGNAKCLPFKTDEIDVVILFSVLTCIISDEEQISVINEIRRVLKPNGIIVLDDFLLNNDERNMERYQKYRKKFGTYGCFELPEGAVLRHHDKTYIKRLLADFKEIEFQEYEKVTMNGHISRAFSFYGRNRK